MKAKHKTPHGCPPCNGCTLCCRGDAVRLFPDENASRWQTVPHPFVPGARMLAHKSNGDCVYVGPTGCTIHGRAPRMCETFDCRTVAKRIDAETARELEALGKLPVGLWARGRELRNTLK